MEIIIAILSGASLIGSVTTYLKLRSIEKGFPQYVDLEFQPIIEKQYPPTADTDWWLEGIVDGSGILSIPEDIYTEGETLEEAQAKTDEFVRLIQEQLSKPAFHTTDDLPPNYDDLSQEDIIYLLPRMTPLAINEVRAYETQNLKRQPILSTVEAIIRNHYRLIS